jgi:hypothetical protein
MFAVWTLTENMRIRAIMLDHASTAADRAYANSQQRYVRSLECMGRNDDSDDCHVVETKDNHRKIVALPLVGHYMHSQRDDAITWLYEGDFSADAAVVSVILAANNKSVDDWNEYIQNKNASQSVTLTSHDHFCDVDDERGIISRLMTEHVLDGYNKNGIPPHSLLLKVNDVCLLLNPMMSDGVASNTRVTILKITSTIIWAKTIESTSRTIMIPRHRFKFRLTYGQSFQLMRVQFPLRLAYAMTYNKSQSQTLKRTLIDCREQPFCHGHLYVASSRVRNCSDIKYYFHDDDIYVLEHKTSVVENVVYQSLLI